jgi:deglycase
MTHRLREKRVAMLVEGGFEEAQLTEPKKALEAEGAEVEIVSPRGGTVRSWKQDDWGPDFPVDRALSEVSSEEYDALVLPGGVMNPDRLRMNGDAVSFVRAFFEQGKPVAAICHGPRTLIDAGVLGGRAMTSSPSLKTDLLNAGAEWLDREVVVDNGLVTSRSPEDLPVFCRKTVERIAEGRHARYVP